MPNLRKIEAAVPAIREKKKVAAYARVSMQSEMCFLRLGMGIDSQDLTRTSRRGKDSGKKFYSCCFPCAVRTQKTEYFPCTQRQGELL